MTTSAALSPQEAIDFAATQPSCHIAPLFYHVRKARKSRPEAGILPGDAYYRWYDRVGRCHYSLTPPSNADLIWPERLALIQGVHDRLLAGEQARQQTASLNRQRATWTREFLDQFFGGIIPQGSSDGQRAVQWTPQDGGPKPHQDAAAICCHVSDHRSPSGRSTLLVGGPPTEVAAHIQFLILSDNCTHMYEHMLLRFGGVLSVDPFVVTLTKSHYAGD